MVISNKFIIKTFYSGILILNSPHLQNVQADSRLAENLPIKSLHSNDDPHPRQHQPIKSLFRHHTGESRLHKVLRAVRRRGGRGDGGRGQGGVPHRPRENPLNRSSTSGTGGLRAGGADSPQGGVPETGGSGRVRTSSAYRTFYWLERLVDNIILLSFFFVS